MKKIETRKTYEIKFTADQYEFIKAIVEAMGLKIKQVRGSMLNGNFIGTCRMDFRASKSELNKLFANINKYSVETI